jgi:hypothetical protein
MKIVLQNVNLVSMTTSYQSGGSPLVENYQFIARDYYFTDAKIGDKLPSQRATVPSPGEDGTVTIQTTTSTTTSGTKTS